MGSWELKLWSVQLRYETAKHGTVPVRSPPGTPRFASSPLVARCLFYPEASPLLPPPTLPSIILNLRAIHRKKQPIRLEKISSNTAKMVKAGMLYCHVHRTLAFLLFSFRRIRRGGVAVVQPCAGLSEFFATLMEQSDRSSASLCQLSALRRFI